jgi:hypothetical protein
MVLGVDGSGIISKRIWFLRKYYYSSPVFFLKKNACVLKLLLLLVIVNPTETCRFS